MKRNYQDIIDSLTDENISVLISQMEINNIINDQEAGFDITEEGEKIHD